MDYSELTDDALLRQYNTLLKEEAEIPLDLIQEIKTRGLLQRYLDEDQE